MKNLNNYRGGGIYKTPLIETYLMPVEGGFLNSFGDEGDANGQFSGNYNIYDTEL